MNIDFDQLRELLSIFSQSDICELSVESGEEKITVKKAGACSTSAAQTTDLSVAQSSPDETVNMQIQASPSASSSNSEIGASSSTTPAILDQNNLLKITSPMVGTFYRSPAPNKPPFVEAGDVISVGQTVCIIEAMKLMNDLPSEVSGKIVEVLAQTGATVEYGQTLFLVDPEA